MVAIRPLKFAINRLVDARIVNTATSTPIPPPGLSLSTEQAALRCSMINTDPLVTLVFSDGRKRPTKAYRDVPRRA